MRAENDTLKDELNVADDALETQSQWVSESRAALAQLQSENAALRQWKAEALSLLTRYDSLAETFGGKLGSSKVTNLERGVAALREQLADAAREINCSGSIAERIRVLKQEHQSQLAQVTSERDEVRRKFMRTCTHPNTYPLKETTRRCHDCGLEFYI